MLYVLILAKFPLPASKIHISETTQELLVKSNEGFEMEERGTIELKVRMQVMILYRKYLNHIMI